MIYFTIAFFPLNSSENARGYFLNENFEVIKEVKKVYNKGEYTTALIKLMLKYKVSRKIMFFGDTLEDGIKHIKSEIRFQQMKRDGKIKFLSDTEIDRMIDDTKKGRIY